jgi:hypothetical protein
MSLVEQVFWLQTPAKTGPAVSEASIAAATRFVMSFMENPPAGQRNRDTRYGAPVLLVGMTITSVWRMREGGAC